MKNPVMHFEIAAENPEKLIAFYGKMFDWKIQKGGMPYWLVTTRAKTAKYGINGGIFKKQGTRSGVLNYVEVENIDKSIAKAVALGATINGEKRAVPGMGWAASLKDLEGNGFGLWQDDVNAK